MAQDIIEDNIEDIEWVELFVMALCLLSIAGSIYLIHNVTPEDAYKVVYGMYKPPGYSDEKFDEMMTYSREWTLSELFDMLGDVIDRKMFLEGGLIDFAIMLLIVQTMLYIRRLERQIIDREEKIHADADKMELDLARLKKKEEDLLKREKLLMHQTKEAKKLLDQKKELTQ